MKPDTAPLRKWAMKHLVKTDRIVRVTHGSEGYYSYEDMGEIVRCMDCHWLKEDDSRWYCCHMAMDIGWVGRDEPDGFCAWAKRKEKC